MSKTEQTNRTADIEDMKLYTLTELESVLGVTHRSLLTYVTAGKLKAKKIGGKWRVTKADLKDFIDNQ